MDPNTQLKLPIELILRVIESLAPRRAVALPPDHLTAFSIRACMLVSRSVYPVALRLLYCHCLYIDKSERLCRLLVSIEIHTSKTKPKTSPGFSQLTNYDSSNEDGYSPSTLSPPTTNTNNTTFTLKSNTLPEVTILPSLQNLYLAPFRSTSIDDLPTAQWIFELLSLTRHTLRRLVTKIPLRTLPPWRDHLSVRRWLYRGFAELQRIEEFVCLCDDLDLRSPSTDYPSAPTVPVWATWRNLRRLSLRSTKSFITSTMMSMNVDDRMCGYLKDLGALERLEKLVLFPTDPNRLGEGGGWDKMFERLMDGRENDLEVIWPAVVRLSGFNHDDGGVYGYHVERVRQAKAWSTERKAQGLSSVRFCAVAVNPEVALEEEKSKSGKLHLQNWMKDRATKGELFDLEGCARFGRCRVEEDVFVDRSIYEREWMMGWMKDYA